MNHDPHIFDLAKLLAQIVVREMKAERIREKMTTQTEKQAPICDDVVNQSEGEK